MNLMSTTTLSKHLVAFGAASTSFNTRTIRAKAPMASGFDISNETYGQDSHLYIKTPDVATRHRLEAFLQARGARVNLDYWPSSSTVDVQVSYFKGWHHDE